jgi:2-dehydro-3-deoxygalactonokinase
MAGAIAIDWGTSNFRAYRLDGKGAVLAERKAAAGISTVPPGGFPGVLQSIVGDWLAEDPSQNVIMAGMVGSRNGWSEAPYAPLPANAADLRGRLTEITRPDGGKALIVPGVSAVIGGMGEVIRGEETLAIGSGIVDGVILSPGTHPKWITLADGRITGFTTFLTGEFFAVLTAHSLLGRLMQDPADAAEDWAGFDRGLEMAAHPAGLTHTAFAARSDVLLGRMKPGEARSYLSGLLIGTEILGAKRNGGLPSSVTLIAEGHKAECYQRALSCHQVGAVRVDSDQLLLAGLKRILSA